MSGSRAGGRRRGWVAAAAFATAAACSSEPAPRSAATAGPPGLMSFCGLERRPLALEDGTEVYVEHEQVILVGDDPLLAGAPSYHWNPRPGRHAERVSSNVIAAAYIGEPVRTVANPLPGTLGSVRVAALDDRRWAAILLLVDPDSLPAIDMVRGLLYGEHDGERWTALEPMEFPGERLTSRLATRLVRAGDRLVWLASEPTLSSASVHVYERVDGAWTRYVLPDEDRVEQLALAYLEGSGLWMLLSGYDAGLPGFQKSLRLFRERPGGNSTSSDRWELVSRVTIAEPGVNLRRASLTVQSTGVTVSWMAVGRGSSTAMARVGIGPDAPGTIVTLDEGSFSSRPAAMPDGSVVWLVDRYETGAPVAELRLLGVANGRVVRLAAIPSPFTGSFTVLSTNNSEVLVVGAEMGSDSTDVPVRSLILRLSTSC